MSFQYTGANRYTDADFRVNTQLTAHSRCAPVRHAAVHVATPRGIGARSQAQTLGRVPVRLFLRAPACPWRSLLLFFNVSLAKSCTRSISTSSISIFVTCYGKEGKRSYTPYVCSRIDVLAIRAGGEPSRVFCTRHYDESHLARLFQNVKHVPQEDRNAILALKRITRHYQFACAKHFEVTHPTPADAQCAGLDNRRGIIRMRGLPRACHPCPAANGKEDDKKID